MSQLNVCRVVARFAFCNAARPFVDLTRYFIFTTETTLPFFHS